MIKILEKFSHYSTKFTAKVKEFYLTGLTGFPGLFLPARMLPVECLSG